MTALPPTPCQHPSFQTIQNKSLQWIFTASDCSFTAPFSLSSGPPPPWAVVETLSRVFTVLIHTEPAFRPLSHIQMDGWAGGGAGL